MERLLSAISRFFVWLKQWLWEKPVAPVKKEPDFIRATDVNMKDAFKVILYQGQKINLNNTQLLAFNRMSRKEKREVKAYWAKMERKKEIIFQEINGQTVAIKNLDYDARARKNIR